MERLELNKFNIPIIIDDAKARKGNFIDHFKLLEYNFKRRNISHQVNVVVIVKL